MKYTLINIKEIIADFRKYTYSLSFREFAEKIDVTLI